MNRQWMTHMTEIRLLEVARYPRKRTSTGCASFGEHEPEFLADPSWADIEEAIRRLDRDKYPSIWLHLTDPVDQDGPQGLNIMGGRGEYALSISLPGQLVYYDDPKRGDEVILIWESDQGSSLPERSLCNDVDFVVAIARHFADTGRPHPGSEWRK